jgi:manganese/zinc/iron transport system ATP- binding protein
VSDRPLIKFKNASVGYGRKPVLTGVDLELPRGATLGVFGYNGSGKTTILKSALGIIPVLSGKLERGTKRLGYVPQKERLDPIFPLDAEAVVELGACQSWKPFARRTDLALRCLGDCGADHLARRRFSELSGGQKQRVLIARALAADPEVLLLDEPLAGVDVVTQRALIDLLHELRLARGLTFLMISHRLQVERDLFTHLAWVDEGKVEWGPAAQMLKGRVGEVFRGELG